MMDFLRRLAPSRETDATRAFALLPSRFAGETPLRAALAPGQPPQHRDDDEALLSPDAASAPSANDTLAAQPHRVTSVPLFQTAPRPLAGEPTPGFNREAISPAYAPAEAPGTPVADRRPFKHRHGENPESASPKRQNLVAAMGVSPSPQVVTTPATQARAALPLSQAILAQRTCQSRDVSQVVHVTIGRIEVVANTAPAPAVRRSPAPRQPTVTLADYLRGSHGGRQ